MGLLFSDKRTWQGPDRDNCLKQQKQTNQKIPQIKAFQGPNYQVTNDNDLREAKQSGPCKWPSCLLAELPDHGTGGDWCRAWQTLCMKETEPVARRRRQLMPRRWEHQKGGSSTQRTWRSADGPWIPTGYWSAHVCRNHPQPGRDPWDGPHTHTGPRTGPILTGQTGKPPNSQDSGWRMQKIRNNSS